MYVVYKHTTPSGKVYIGITGKKPEYRWKNGNGYKDNAHFDNAIKKYGWENTKHEIVANGLTKEQACDLEIELIAKYHATDQRKGYNISAGGECSGAGVHPSAETRRKISEAKKGANHPYYGKHLAAEHRRKISESEKGVNNPFYGKHHSAETRRKISEANKGKHYSAETLREMSESHKGKHPSSETRRKISESEKGRTPWDKGKHHSAETRRKISEANKGKNAKAVICIETGAVYSSGTEAAKAIGVTQEAISQVLRGKAKTSGGYHWKYAPESDNKRAFCYRLRF